MIGQTVPTKIRLLQINAVQCGSTLFMNYAPFYELCTFFYELCIFWDFYCKRASEFCSFHMTVIRGIIKFFNSSSIFS